MRYTLSDEDKHDDDIDCNEGEDGWGDEDDLEGLLDDSNDDNNVTNVESTVNKPTCTATQQQQQQQQQQPSQEGWDFDWEEDDIDINDDDGDDDDDGNNVKIQPPQVLPPAAVTRTQTQQAEISDIQQKLTDYIITLCTPSQSVQIIDRINHIFQTKTNTHDTALTLCHYYHARPHLTSYTIEKEMPRMEYQIIIDDTCILNNHDKTFSHSSTGGEGGNNYNENDNSIQEYFQHNPIDNLVDDMLMRASNQSLLADLIPIISDNKSYHEYNMVPSTLFAAAIATKCKFVIDLRKEQGHTRTTQVECIMTISVPCHHYQSSSPIINNNKLNIANARFLIHFSPDPVSPFITYQLISIQSLLHLNKIYSKDYQDYIQSAAITIHELSSVSSDDANDTHIQQPPQQHHQTQQMNDTIRDQFLQLSIMSTTSSTFTNIHEKYLSTTTKGFQNAWSDFDNVVNVKSKIQKLSMLKDSATYVFNELQLPTKEAMDILEQQQQEEDDGEEEVAERERLEPQKHHYHQKLPPPKAAASRPIIGGLLMSGISHLKDALENSHIDHHNSNVQSRSIPKLYRRDTNDDEVEDNYPKNNVKEHDQKITLKNNITTSGDVNGNQIKNFSHSDNSNPVIATVKTMNNTLMDNNDDNDDDAVGDGWSDYDDDFDDIEKNDSGIENNSNNNHQDVTNTEKEEAIDDDNDDDNEYVQVESHTIMDDYDDDNEKEYELFTKMKKLMNIKLDTNTYVPDDFVYDETTGIIPTRKRWVSHSDLLSTIDFK